MTADTDRSAHHKSGRARFRFVVIVCLLAFGLPVLYVLLSAPLLLYAAHHLGSSYAHRVDVYMRPLLWVDELLDDTSESAEYPAPLHSKILNGYYRLWGSEVEQQYHLLHLMRYLESARESMEESTPFLGIEGPDSPIP